MVTLLKRNYSLNAPHDTDYFKKFVSCGAFREKALFIKLDEIFKTIEMSDTALQVNLGVKLIENSELYMVW